MPPRKYRPVLPNKASPHQTAASLSFDVHYAKLGIEERWDRDRYDRLCSFANLTRYELASLIRWRHGQVERAVENSDFPGPVALLLTVIEAQLLNKFSADIIEQPFPSHA